MPRLLPKLVTRFEGASRAAAAIAMRVAAVRGAPDRPSLPSDVGPSQISLSAKSREELKIRWAAQFANANSRRCWRN